MSGDGGDSGGDSGGSGKGGGGGVGSDYTNGGYGNPGAAVNSGNEANYGSNSYAATSPGEQAGFQGDGSGNSGSLDSFISDPTGSGSNLSGPGPVGGDPGLAGAGGGTNQPLSFSDYSFNNPLSGVSADSFTGGGTGSDYAFNSPLDGISADSFSGNTPGAASGVSGAGANTVLSPTGSAAAPDSIGGASAATLAAPGGVSGNPDSTSVTSDLDKIRAPAGGSSTSSSDGGGNSNILKTLGIGGNNGAGALVAGAGLLNNLVNKNNNTVPYSPALNQNAASANATSAQQTSAGQALQQWQTTGKLPDSYESQVQQAAQAAKQRLISNAAAQGLPTDPTMNTALAQGLQSIDAQIPQQREAIAKSLADSGSSMISAGLTATGISSNVYQTLATLQNSQNQQQAQAITNFATALNGGAGAGKGLTLKVA